MSAWISHCARTGLPKVHKILVVAARRGPASILSCRAPGPASSGRSPWLRCARAQGYSDGKIGERGTQCVCIFHKTNVLCNITFPPAQRGGRCLTHNIAMLISFSSVPSGLPLWALLFAFHCSYSTSNTPRSVSLCGTFIVGHGLLSQVLTKMRRVPNTFR